MRIDRISVENFIGIRSVDLPLNGTVTAIFGANGSGKSSLKDAVSFCALGETARAPKMKKKDFTDLLHPGAKRGQATLVIDGVTFSRGLPSGNCSTATPDPPKGWEYLLDPVAFLRLGLEERRKELFRVLGVAMDSGSILAKLVERGYEEPVLVRIRSFLRQGFAIAATEVQMIARETKGRWRQITGEDWGAKKGGEWFCVVEGEEWSAEIGVPPPVNLGDSRQTLAHLEGQLAGLDGQIGVARREQAMAVQRAAQERQAKEQASRARQEAERVQQRIAELRKVVAGEATVREEQQAAVEALAEATQSWNEAQAATVPADVNAYEYTCGSCGRTVVLVAARGPLTGHVKLTEPTNDAEVNARVTLVKAKRALTEAETKLRSIDTASHVLDELLATQGQPTETPAEEAEPIQREYGAPADPERALFALEDRRKALARALQEARMAVRRVEDHQQRVAQAKQRTADAAALHGEIETWLRLAEDLGPGGIPAQLLHQAIDPINDRLAYSGNSLGFMGLSLTPEMELVGCPEENDPKTPRRYELVSGSAQWRMEAALADAIGVAAESWYSGSCQPSERMPIVLDRFDVLDGPGRGKAIRWLLSLGRQVILLGTLRNRDVPAELPQGISVGWLQAGKIMPPAGIESP